MITRRLALALTAALTLAGCSPKEAAKPAAPAVQEENTP